MSGCVYRGRVQYHGRDRPGDPGQRLRPGLPGPAGRHPGRRRQTPGKTLGFEDPNMTDVEIIERHQAGPGDEGPRGHEPRPPPHLRQGRPGRPRGGRDPLRDEVRLPPTWPRSAASTRARRLRDPLPFRQPGGQHQRPDRGPQGLPPHRKHLRRHPRRHPLRAGAPGHVRPGRRRTSPTRAPSSSRRLAGRELSRCARTGSSSGRRRRSPEASHEVPRSPSAPSTRPSRSRSACG